MKRPLKPEERHIWGIVAATVHPLPGKATPSLPSPSGEEEAAPAARAGKSRSSPDAAFRPTLPHPTSAEFILGPADGRTRGPRPPSPFREGKKAIEPRRKHRISKERDPIGARLDLHGLDQDRARGALERFLTRAWDEGYRAVLVITGKGVQGDGVLKRRAPEWLAAPHLAHIVAGISDASRNHGGEGALYVALKRKARG
jgi:DNA-nicking Smr family endonuclease